MDQLKLALTWNRVDVAEEKIFTPDTDWPVSRKDSAYTAKSDANAVAIH